jgi:pSer/pThr/pTyr-binding forkhead associated (FHA) protein
LERDRKAKELVGKVGCSVLLGLENTNEDKVWLEKDAVTLGKSRFADIKVKGFFLSKIQARITKQEDSFYLVNLGRRNKARVNGTPTLRQRLKNDDLIQVGRSIFRFVEGNR